VLWWRSVGHSHNGFAVEAFFDELAHAGGKDPYELRRTLLADQPSMRGVLEFAAQKGDWGKPLPAGRARGIATHFSFESYVAQVDEVSVDKQGPSLRSSNTLPRTSWCYGVGTRVRVALCRR
jgi:isoquinoline 1-oxidoreductase beta subunit